MDSIMLEHTYHCKYLGVILQSDLKFTDHIADKICSARKQIGMIRRALHWALERARLIAYKPQIGRWRLSRLCKIKE